jgi:hypothetical protein
MPVLIDLLKLRVRSLDVSFNEVSWEVADTSEDVLDYSFQILRSESPSGPFDILTVPFSDRFFFIDNNLKNGNRWRKYYYLVRVVQLTSGDTLDFGPVTHEPDADILAIELRRHMQLLFHEYAGRRMWALVRRTFGQRCDCYNRVLMKKTRSGCRTCYDTSFVRGYMSPIEVYGQIDPNPKADQQTNVGRQQQSNTTGRLGYYPPLKPDDMLIEAENRRWRVTKVSMTEQGRAPVHQEIEMHEIPSTDIEFLVPLNMEHALKDLFISPARNFSNPTSLENFEQEEMPNVFALYDNTTRTK